MELTINKAVAQLKNVNLRTENNGDERVLACDLKIVADVDADDVRPLFLDTPDFLDTLWDEKNQVLNHEIELRLRLPIENVELQLDDLVAHKGGKVKKGTLLVPRNGKRFTMTATLQLSDIADVRPLAKRLHEEVKVTIIERQQVLPVSSVAA
jgi:hypothetical protein